MIVATNRSRGKRWPHGFEELGALMTSEKNQEICCCDLTCLLTSFASQANWMVAR
jgi:hypothetical protein